MIILIRFIIIITILFSTIIKDSFAQDQTLAPSNPTDLGALANQPQDNISPNNPSTQIPETSPTAESLANQQNPPSDVEVSTADAIDQIQKTLLFSDQNAAKRKSVERKSSLNIDRADKSDQHVVEVTIENNNLPKAQQKIIEKQNMAYKASVAGQYEVAIELYKQILKLDHNNHYASFALAACYHKLGQFARAKSLYYELLKHKWDDEQTENELVNNLIEVVVEESPNEAIYLLNKLSIQNPNSPQILSGTAMAYDKIGKEDKAILLLRKAINIDPKEIRYKLNLAIIYDKTANYEQALKYYQEVMNGYLLGQDPDNSLPIEQVKQRIDFIKQEYSA